MPIATGTSATAPLSIAFCRLLATSLGPRICPASNPATTAAAMRAPA